MELFRKYLKLLENKIAVVGLIKLLCKGSELTNKGSAYAGQFSPLITAMLWWLFSGYLG